MPRVVNGGNSRFGVGGICHRCWWGSALLQADLLNDTAQLDAEEIDMTFST